MNRSPVYIAAPYGAPTAELRTLNTQRAVLLAKVAHRLGLLPICQHPLIDAGVFGDDGTPRQREAGIQASLAAMGMVLRHTGGRLWVLEAAHMKLSPGTKREVDAWRKLGGKPIARNGPWSAWENIAYAHALRGEWSRLGDEYLRAEIEAGVTIMVGSGA